MVAEKARGERPLTVRGENKTILSIFVSENKLTFSVSRKTENGFERIDRFVIPVAWLMAELIRRNKDVLADWCEFLTAAVEEGTE
jgi:hypothetical protein